MHILVTSTSGTGHLHPMVPTLRALSRRGHDITWAAPEAARRSVEGFGFVFRPAGLDHGERRSRFMSAHPEVMAVPPRSRRPLLFAGFFAEIAAPVMAIDLAPVFEEVRPDLVVHDLAELAAAPLAAARSIPHITMAFSGALTPEILRVAVPVIEPVWAAVGLSAPPDLGMYDHGYVHPFARSLGQRPDDETVYDVRPMDVTGKPGGTAPGWLQQMGLERPLVYVTFGTEVGAIAPWPALLGVLALVDVDAVVTVGGEVDPASLAPLVAHLPEGRIRIERYVPQALVVPRARLVVSHGGAGTAIGAAAAGVPQLIVPLGADQFDNADLFADAGVALVAEGDAVDATALAGQLRSLLQDGAFAGAAARLAADFAAMPHSDEVAAVLDRA